MSTELAPVRLANINDMNQLMRMGQMLHEENAMLPWDDALIEELVLAYITYNPSKHFADPGMIAVIEQAGRLEGMIALRITRLWYSSSPLIEEIFNFVHPDHRRSNHAKALIQYAKSLAEDLRLPLMIGIVSNDRTEEKIRLYSRYLPFAGAFFVYRGDLIAADKAA